MSTVEPTWKLWRVRKSPGGWATLYWKAVASPAVLVMRVDIDRW